MRKDNAKTYAMLMLGLGMIVVGIVAGQNQDVLMKAIKICLECVGIG